MLVTQEQRDQFDRLRARRDAVVTWNTNNAAFASQINPLIDQVDSIGSNFLTVDPRDIEQKALGALEQAETIASQHGFQLPPDYHKTPATISPPEQTVTDVAAQAYDEATKLGVSGCKEIWPAFVCETRLPYVSEIPWWVWAGGAIGVGAAGLYLYALYKLAPTAARIGAAVYAPELLPAVNAAFPMKQTTPAVQEALTARQATQAVWVNGQRVA